MSLSGLILVLSGINFINLNTAQASQRAKEVGVRKALGSSKRKIIVQFLLETLIMYATAFVISMVVLELLLPIYGKYLGKEIKIQGFQVYLYAVLLSSFSPLFPELFQRFIFRDLSLFRR